MPFGGLMEDRIKQFFLISFCVFALLIWHNFNQPNFYSSEEYSDYHNYINQKVERIISEKEGNIINTRATASENANCLGCCNDQGGVVCIGGKTTCKDGGHLSYTCQNKGCNACPVLKE